VNALVVSALLVTLAVEVPIVALLYRGARTRMALVCASITGLTNVAMNAWLFDALASYETYLLTGELGATVLEAAVYALASPRRHTGRALVAAGLANAASFAAGLVIY
jgi:hypothetical protein